MSQGALPEHVERVIVETLEVLDSIYPYIIQTGRWVCLIDQIIVGGEEGYNIQQPPPGYFCADTYDWSKDDKATSGFTGKPGDPPWPDNIPNEQIYKTRARLVNGEWKLPAEWKDYTIEEQNGLLADTSESLRALRERIIQEIGPMSIEAMRAIHAGEP